MCDDFSPDSSQDFFCPNEIRKRGDMLTILNGLLTAVKENMTSVIISLTVVALSVILLFFVERYVSGRNKRERVTKTSYLTSVAFLSAIAGVLMLFEFPIPFIAPGFYKIDFSEVPVLVGAFALGPVAGIIIEFIKILINLFINGTTTAFIGEIANFTIGVCYVLPASVLYYFGKNKKEAIAGMAFGTVFTTTIGVLLNAYVLIPFYAVAFGGVEKIIAAGTAVNPNINSVLSFCFIAVAPFNLLKFTLVSVITFSLYGSIKKVIRRG